MVYFIFGYFSTKLGTYRHEKNSNLKVSLNSPNKGLRVNIVQILYYGKCTGKRGTLQNLFLQNI
jgi:hypothetical protein